jgi:hypothetical protein
MWGVNVELRLKARAEAKALGHDLLNFRSWTDSNQVQHSVTACLQCGKWAMIENPGVGVYGEAMKNKCKK